MSVSIGRGNTIRSLNGSNYTTWAMRMKDLLGGEGVWEITTGEEIKPKAPIASSDRQERRDWNEYSQHRQKATSLMRLAMDEDIALNYNDSKFDNPQELWKSLKAEFEKIVRYDADHLQNELYNIWLEEHGSVRAYVAAIKQLKEKLATCDIKLTDHQVYFHLFHGLPATWNVWKEVTKGLATDKTKWADVVLKLEAHEAELKREAGIEPGQAFYAKSGKKGKAGNVKRGSNKKRSEEKKDDAGKRVVCFHCGKQGHCSDLKLFYVFLFKLSIGKGSVYLARLVSFVFHYWESCKERGRCLLWCQS